MLLRFSSRLKNARGGSVFLVRSVATNRFSLGGGTKIDLLARPERFELPTLRFEV